MTEELWHLDWRKPNISLPQGVLGYSLLKPHSNETSNFGCTGMLHENYFRPVIDYLSVKRNKLLITEICKMCFLDSLYQLCCQEEHEYRKKIAFLSCYVALCSSDFVSTLIKLHFKFQQLYCYEFHIIIKYVYFLQHWEISISLSLQSRPTTLSSNLDIFFCNCTIIQTIVSQIKLQDLEPQWGERDITG